MTDVFNNTWYEVTGWVVFGACVIGTLLSFGCAVDSDKNSQDRKYFARTSLVFLFLGPVVALYWIPAIFVLLVLLIGLTIKMAVTG